MTSPLLPEAGHSGPRFLPADVIADRFEVVRFIARGGMGEVYEVKDRFLQGVNHKSVFPRNRKIGLCSPTDRGSIFRTGECRRRWR
jgi:ribosomal protein S28E/S33